MSKKLGNLIKEARTAKGLSQAALAEKVDGISASDVSKIERGEKEPVQDVIKQIAKVLGVTQKSLLDAATGKTRITTTVYSYYFEEVDSYPKNFDLSFLFRGAFGRNRTDGVL